MLRVFRNPVRFLLLSLALPLLLLLHNPRSASAQAPPTPTGVTASPGNQAVTVSWTASTGATSYHVKRSLVTGGPYTTLSSPTGTTYTDTPLKNGTTYYYVVSAVNGYGESPNSTEVSATPQPPPDSPTGLVVTGTSSNSISLAWQASARATGYKVKRASASTGPFSTFLPRLPPAAATVISRRTPPISMWSAPRISPARAAAPTKWRG